MKKIFTFLGLAAIGMASAQSYTPIPTNDVNWNGIFSAFIVNHYHETICGDDTIINSQSYEKVYQHYYNLPNTITGSYYRCALRNDTLNKKVWYIPAGSSTEDLLFDFNLNAGDSITLTINDLTPYTYTYHVLSTSTVTINSIARKKIVFDTLFGWFNEVWIEGIGSSEGLYNRAYVPSGSASHALECMIVNGNFIIRPIKAATALFIPAPQESAMSITVLSQSVQTRLQMRFIFQDLTRRLFPKKY